MSRTLAALAFLGVFLVVVGGLAYYYGYVYVPPPSTDVERAECQVVGQSQVVIGGGGGPAGYSFDLSSSPPAPLAPLAVHSCSFVDTKIVTSMRCGVMCGGGIGDSYYYARSWELNFSLGSPSSDGGNGAKIGENVTISGGSLGILMLYPSNRVYVDSQEVAWYSDPPCGGSVGSGYDCLSPGATSLTVELPTPAQSGDFVLVTNSTKEEVP